MTEGADAREVRVVRLLALTVLGAAALRLLVSVVGGFAEWHRNVSEFYPSGRARAFDVLSTFGTAGDGTGVLLALAAGGLLWWAMRLGDPPARSLRTTLVWVFAVTAILAVMGAVGSWLLFPIDAGDQATRVIITTGFAAAYVAVSIVGIAATRQLDAVSDELLLEGGDGADSLVFAVDRDTGNVRAFFSIGEAARKMHVYSVEDNEYAFYTDEGVVLDATVEHGRIMLRPTETNQRAVLLDQLKAFANDRGLSVDSLDADDASAYVVPISDWQWLQMWPPWTRWLGHLFRPRMRG